MMKRFLYILLTMITCGVIAQDYVLTFEQVVTNDEYSFSVYIEGDGDPFVLGSSNFPFELHSAGIDKSTLVMETKGEFSEQDPESYRGLYYSNSPGFEHLYLLRNVMGNGLGETVDNERRLLATFKADVVDPCETAQIVWLTDVGTITNFKGDVINENALFKNSEVINLSNDLSEPEIVNEGGALVAMETENVSYQWYLNDEPIQGATEATYDFEDNGVYRLSASNACETVYSEELEVSSVTSIAESEIVELELSAYPNPYTGKTSIEVDVPENDEFKLTINDLTGSTIETVYEGALSQGKHEFSFSVSDYGLASGVYVLRLTSEKESRNIKIIETE